MVLLDGAYFRGLNNTEVFLFLFHPHPMKRYLFLPILCCINCPHLGITTTFPTFCAASTAIPIGPPDFQLVLIPTNAASTAFQHFLSNIAGRILS